MDGVGCRGRRRQQGTWLAANGYMSDTTALGQNDAFWRAQTNGDTDLRFSYRDTRSSTGYESLQVRVRACVP